MVRVRSGRETPDVSFIYLYSNRAEFGEFTGDKSIIRYD